MRCVANKTGWRTPRTIFFVTNAKRTQEGVISISLKCTRMISVWPWTACSSARRRSSASLRVAGAGREGCDVVRPIQIGAIQTIAVDRRLSRWDGARPSLPIALVLIIGEQSVQAKRILSRWSRHEDGGADTTNALIRRRRQLGRAVLRKLLVEMVHFAPLHCRFGVEPEGSPFIRDANQGGHTSISLAHAGGWLAGALSVGAPIGIDIEYHKPDRDFAALASAAFGPQERWRVEGGGATEFYRIWTLREAMAKARGVGLSFVIDGRDHVTRNAAEAFNWYLHHSEPLPGLSVAVVVGRRSPQRRGKIYLAGGNAATTHNNQ
jgi:4'-phosphopantetheinyl transferase